MRRLSVSFYKNSTINVATGLLGKMLIRSKPGGRWAGKIVEVEAYIGEDDPACHAFHGLTPRTSVMYGPPGHAYVYFTYGMYFMLNIVTEREGFPAAVLIRALEPVSGFEHLEPHPTNGPGKLCRSLDIDKSLNGTSLRGKELWIAQPDGKQEKLDIRWSPRIGVSAGADKLWRAYIYGSPHVSRKGNSQDPREPVPR